MIKTFFKYSPVLAHLSLLMMLLLSKSAKFVKSPPIFPWGRDLAVIFLILFFLHSPLAPPPPPDPLLPPSGSKSCDASFLPVEDLREGVGGSGGGSEYKVDNIKAQVCHEPLTSCFCKQPIYSIS